MAVEFCQMLFLHLLRWLIFHPLFCKCDISHWYLGGFFCLFFVFCFYIWMLNQSCNPGIIPTWSWCVILLLFCWIFVEDFCCVHQGYLCLVLVQSNFGLIKWVWKSFLFFYFFMFFVIFFVCLKTFGLYFLHLPHPLTVPLCPQVSLVLSALQAGNKGTQACITAATAVSGIIADLDTTIMFATAGTLNAENNETFADHRYGSDSHPGGSWTGRSSVWPDGLWRCCPTSRNMVMHFYFKRMFRWRKWTT